MITIKKTTAMYLMDKSNASELIKFIAGLKSWVAKVANEDYDNLVLLEARFNEIIETQTPRFVPWVYVEGFVEIEETSRR